MSDSIDNSVPGPSQAPRHRDEVVNPSGPQAGGSVSRGVNPIPPPLVDIGTYREARALRPRHEILTPSKFQAALDALSSDEDESRQQSDISVQDSDGGDDDYVPTAEDLGPSGVEEELSGFSALEDSDDERPATPEEARGRPSTRSRARGRGRASSSRRRVGGRRRRVVPRGGGQRAPEVAGDLPEEGADEVDDEGWHADAEPAQQHPFTATPGLCADSIPTTALGFFQLFFTPELLEFLTLETNSYWYYRKFERGEPCSHPYKEVTMAEMATYVGLLFCFGVAPLPRVHMYWTRDEFYTMPYIAQAMARDRFYAIKKYFHTFNRKAIPKRNTDKLVVVRTMMEYIQEKCQTVYIPREFLSLDEGMLGFRGRLLIKVYQPNKPTRYGIKFYFLTEDEGYVVNFTPYSGVSRTLREIVKELLRDCLGKGYHVFMDNFYNSVGLSEELHQLKTHCTGTLRLNRGAPKSLKAFEKGNTTRGALMYRKKDNTTVLCWKDVRCVNMISNYYGPETERFVHRRRIKTRNTYRFEEVELERPCMIQEYSKHMGGVDLFDQMLSYYPVPRKTTKWTTKFIYYCIQMCLQNAHFLYYRYTTDRRKLDLVNFQCHIAKALMEYIPGEWIFTGDPLRRAPDLPEEDRLDNMQRDQQPDDLRIDDEEEELLLDVPNVPAPPSTADTRVPRRRHPQAPPPPPPAAGDPRPQSPEEMEEEEQEGSASEDLTPQHRRYIPDPKGRLSPHPGHFMESLYAGEERGTRARQKPCRVCQKNKIRKDTSHKCHKCKIPLCDTMTRNCFNIYHSTRQYWMTSPTGAARPRGRGRRPST